MRDIQGTLMVWYRWAGIELFNDDSIWKISIPSQINQTPENVSNRWFVKVYCGGQGEKICLDRTILAKSLHSIVPAPIPWRNLLKPLKWDI